jgi:hypothetical protein
MSTKDELIKLIRDSQANGKELTISKVANDIGVNRNTLSKYLNNRYKFNPAMIEARIQKYLDKYHNSDTNIESEIAKDIISESEPLTDTDPDFIETKNSKTIFEIAEMVRIEREIGIVTGRAGIGKTYSLKEYARHHPDVLLIEADLTFTPKVLIREICAHLGIITGLGLHDMFEGLVEKMADMDIMLIIDEAEHLPVRGIDILRRNHDKTYCGILICGLPQLLLRLKSLRGDYAYIFSRIGIGAKLEAPTKKDVYAIVHSMMDDASEKICESFYEYSTGSIRILVKLIRRSIRVARINNMPVTREIIAESAKLLTL